ncbi:MAG: hypothetical protein AAE976_03820 [Thermoplasmataceae archaeon]
MMLSDQAYLLNLRSLISMQPIESQYSPELKTNRKRMTYVAIAVIIIVSGYFAVSNMSTGDTVNVMWLQVNMQYTAGSGNLGPAVQYIQENVHTISGGTDHTFTITLHDRGTSPSSVLSISSDTPGFLIKSSSNLPILVKPDSTTTLSFTVSTPSANFVGNLVVTLVVGP